MSKLGYIQSSYGKQFNIAISNTYTYNVLGGSNLPSNTLIVSSPVDDEGNDTGTYSISVTDYTGTPVRLTYTIIEGNGLKYSDDSISLNIDNASIIENETGELSANLSYLIDNYTIKLNDNNVYIDLDNLNKISSSGVGLFKIDEKTIKSNEGSLYVDTSNLNYANEGISSGIVIGDGVTVNSDNGILSINQDNIQKSSPDSFGVVKVDNQTLNINEGVISVNTSNLDKCSYSNYGVIKIDSSSIVLNTKNELSVNTSNLDKVSSTNSGVFKYDPNTFEISNDKLSVKGNSYFIKTINDIEENLPLIKQKINEIDTLLNDYKVGIVKPMILDFHCTNSPSFVYRKPNYLNEQIYEMNFQYTAVDFIISTNCPFIINVGFEDNIDPQISLYEVNYNDINVFYGNTGLLERYQSTNSERVPLRLTFIGKNFYDSNVTKYSNKVIIKVTISYANDTSIFKEVLFSILRFNSGYNKEIVYSDVNIEI